jgi:hypothetical protein
MSTFSLDEFMAAMEAQGRERIELVHGLARKVWDGRFSSPFDLQQKCVAVWDVLGAEMDVKIEPLVPVSPDCPVSNLIFGSGGFSTGGFQASQFRVVAEYAANPPAVLQGIVTNKSLDHGSNAAAVAEEYGVPLVELDFMDWYHEHIDAGEQNPVATSRYWYLKNDPARPPPDEMAWRFDLRQQRFHGELGQRIEEICSGPTNSVSARGYNFQFCSSLFHSQARTPRVNDTHPADLTYVNPETGAKLYPGWQAGAIQSMMGDAHDIFRGSLIDVALMDRVEQVDELDEGALLAIGAGVRAGSQEGFTAEEIQSAMKIVDDRVFCTFEPTGLITCWGITDRSVPVTYQDVVGTPVTVNQRGIVVGNAVRSGINAWGVDLERDVAELASFLLAR